MKKNDYIVRIWPSGLRTMGQGVILKSFQHPGVYWMSLETYEFEGGAMEGETYGKVNSTTYVHMLATQSEIVVFKEFGGIRNRKDEVKRYERDELIDGIIGFKTNINN